MKKVLKRWMILIPVAVAIFIVLFAFDDKTRIGTRTLYEEQPLVYITKTGKCYHSYGCYHLTQSQFAIGLYRAQNEGYRRCSACNGWAYETIRVEQKETYKVVD